MSILSRLRSLFSSVGGFVAARNSPQDQIEEATEFTRMMAARLEQALPDHRVEIAQPLVVAVGRPSGAFHALNLTRVYEECRLPGTDIPALLDRRLASMVEMVASDDQPATRSDLRLVIRDATYVNTAMARGREEGQVVVTGKPFVRDLWAIVVIDRPRSVGLLSERQMQALGLTAEEAMEAGRLNVESALPPLADVIQRLPTGSLGGLSDDYEPSRLLLHDQWASLASRTPGGLLVSVPSRNLLLIGAGTQAELMQEVTDKALSEASSPMTNTVLHWTPTGWE